MTTPATLNPWIGRSIGDRQRYRLDERLGVGGMGEVFLAMDTLLGQYMALKLLKDTSIGNDELKKRFEREVQVSAALKSDHIVQVNDYGVTPEGYPFYVMEYLQGQTLGQLVRFKSRLDVRRTVGIISQVCDGLALAHQGVPIWRQGATVIEHVVVVHRDLKPENIFLVRTTLGELVKILDFGIAKIRSDQAENANLTTIFIGTFRYAAPEQIINDPNLDGRADIYSLGIILYEMLSGTDPFGFGIKAHSMTGASWFKAHTSKPPLLLRSQPDCDQISPQLEAVVMRCLQKAPTDRFSSVEELKHALQAAATSADITTIQSKFRQVVPDVPTVQGSSSGQAASQSTVNRPLNPPGQQVLGETTIQVSPSPRQVVPDPTNVQNPAVSGQISPNTTISKPLVPSVQPVPEGTRVQNLTPQGQTLPEATRVQPPTPQGQTLPEATRVQPPTPQGQTLPDVTRVQPPTPQGQTLPDVTRVQPQAQYKQTLPSRPNYRLFSIGAGIVLFIMAIGGVCYASFLFHSLDEIKKLQADKNYDACITEAEKAGQNIIIDDQVQNLLNECRLEYAKQWANQYKFKEAIEEAHKIPDNSQFYQQAQQSIKEWQRI